MTNFRIIDKSAALAANAVDDQIPIWQAGGQHTVTPGQIVSTFGDGVQAGVAVSLPTIKVPASVNAFRTSGYANGGDGGGALYKRVSVMPTHLGRIQTADLSWWEIVPEKGAIDPKQLGAVANGVADDSTAMVNAENTAFTLGAVLFFSQGTYTYNGVFNCRVSIFSYNGKIQQISPVRGVGDWITSATVRLANTTNIVVDGITIDGKSTWQGLAFEYFTNVMIRNTTVTNTMGTGISVQYGNDARLINCRVLTVEFTYAAVYPMPGGSGDGYYHRACHVISYEDCYAYDFTRIGFVSEGYGVGTYPTSIVGISDTVSYSRCVAQHARDIDKSSSEWNAAFWNEHSINCNYYRCTAIDIDSGINQTNGRVSCFLLAGTTEPYDNKQSMRDCAAFCTTNIPYVLLVSGNSERSHAVIDNFSCTNSVSPIRVEGHFSSLVLRNITIDASVAMTLNYAIVVTGGASIGNFVIDNVRCTTNITVAPASSDFIYFASPPALCNLDITNTVFPNAGVDQGATNFMFDSLKISNCDIGVKSAMLSTLIYITNSTLRILFDDTIVFGSVVFATPGVKAVVNNTSLIAAGLATNYLIAGLSTNVTFNSCVFDGVACAYNLTGSSVVRYNNCEFINWTSRQHALMGNYGVATRFELLVSNGRFVGGNVLWVPLDQHGANLPTYTVVTGNTYNTNTFISWATGVTSTGNAQTL